MTQEQFDRYLEFSFDSFSKTLIRNEGRNALEEIKARAKHEISLEMLSYEELEQMVNTDTYLADRIIIFSKELAIPINNPELYRALHYLQPHYREIVLLSFFLDYSDAEIGKELGLTDRAIRYRKKTAINKLKELLNE